MSTKIRSSAIALMAACGLAVTSVAPAVSQAKPINPYRAISTKAAIKKQVVGGLCGTLGQRYKESLRQLEKAHAEEDADGVKRERELANEYLSAGYEFGCGFAA